MIFSTDSCSSRYQGLPSSKSVNSNLKIHNYKNFKLIDARGFREGEGVEKGEGRRREEKGGEGRRREGKEGEGRRRKEKEVEI